MSKNIFLIAMLLLCDLSFAQQSIVGKWHTIDDETGERRSLVEIYEKNNSYFGKIIDLAEGEDKNSVCDECDPDDPRYNQKVIGLEIIKDLKKDDDEWDDGTILDPENGKVYRCKIWLEDDKLVVRGYIGFSLIGRSQTWLPAN